MQKSASQRENVALLTAAVLGSLAFAYGRMAGGSAAFLFPALRWGALAALLVCGCFKRTLTAWIFIAMLLGAGWLRLPRRGHKSARAGDDFPATDQGDHRSAAFATLVVASPDTRAFARWGGWVALNHLLRNRNHHRDLSGPGSD